MAAGIKTRFIAGTFNGNVMTDQNSLANALLTRPEIADTLIYAFGSGAARGSDGDKYSLLQYLTQGAGRIGTSGKSFKPYGSNEVMWAIQGRLTQSLPISGTVTPNTSDVGISFSTFTVPFPQKYFSKNDVLRFEDNTLAIVVEEPYRAGNSWCYVCQINGNDPSEYVTSNALRPGAEVGWDHTAQPEGSEKGGSKEATPMWLKNQMTISRMQYGMTGSSKTDVIIFEIQRPGKKPTRLWMYEKQYQFMLNWSRMLERQYWGGQYNRLSDGSIANMDSSGRPIITGAGIEEQLKSSNYITAPTLTREILNHMMLDVTAASNEASNVNRMVFTGNGGIDEFQKAIEKMLQQTGVVIDSGAGTYIHKKTGDTLEFGAEFTTYRGLLGGRFTVVHHPMFDDETIYTGKDPVTGYTKQSYKMFFMDMSDYGGESNVQFITKGAGGEDRRYIQWFNSGSTTPDFNGNTGMEAVMRSNGFDGFTFHCLSEGGVLVRNPLSCGLVELERPS